MENNPGKGRTGDENLKNQLKSKDKTISSLLNDVKKLEGDLRNYQSLKSTVKTLNILIHSSNQSTIRNKCQDLNKKYANLV